MQRKRYPLEFKIEAVKRLGQRGQRSASEVAEALGVASSQLYDWRRKHDEAARVANGRNESVEEENVRLRATTRGATANRVYVSALKSASF